ncbi:hypothetical protein FRB99_000046 [Tulasnella sp. 403]|nr:hypothetical protein FRB99_000046 [Tulasnella sp. 403]
MAWQSQRKADSSSSHTFAREFPSLVDLNVLRKSTSADESSIYADSPTRLSIHDSYDYGEPIFPRLVNDEASDLEVDDFAVGDAVGAYTYSPPFSTPTKFLARHERKGSSGSSDDSFSLLVRPGRTVHDPLKTRMVRVLSWQLFLSIFACLPVLLVSVFVAILFFDMAWLAYLTLAQTDPPAQVSLPFLPWDLRLVLQVNIAICGWLKTGVRLGFTVAKDWCLWRLRNPTGEAFDFERRDLHYGSVRPGKRVDVYKALEPIRVPDLFSDEELKAVFGNWDMPSQDMTPYTPPAMGQGTIVRVRRGESLENTELSPVIVFIYAPYLGPFQGRKWMYESLGRNLSAKGYTVFIPDLTFYPEGRAKHMIQDIRRVLNWAWENAQKFGGDPDRIYLMGHGLGAHLSLQTILQDAIVRSRENIPTTDGKDPDIPNGLRSLRIYSPEVRLPKIQGLILMSPICDVDAQIVHEARRGIHHISKMRRILGPSHFLAMFHSPAHILHAARNVIQVDLLPSKVLFIHGGLDEEVHHTQSEMMKELLRGVGMARTKLRIYPIGHVETVTSLMLQAKESCSEHILHDLMSFVS